MEGITGTYYINGDNMANDMTICGLFEMELVRKGIMKKGHCSSCFHNGSILEGGILIPLCEKDGKPIELVEQEVDCKEWRIDTR